VTPTSEERLVVESAEAYASTQACVAPQLEIVRLRAEINRIEETRASMQQSLEQCAEERTALERRLRQHEQAHEDLRALNERLSSTIDLLPDATFVIDNDKRVVAWNRAAEKLTGVAKEQILGRGDRAYAEPIYGDRRPLLIDLLDHPDPRREANYASFSRMGTTIVGEARSGGRLLAQGARVWAIAAPLFDRQGKRFGAVEVLRDVTELKLTQDDLERSVSLLQAVLDAALEGILAVDAAGRVQSCNRRLFELWGLDNSSLEAPEQGAPLASMVDKLKDPQRFAARLAELRSTPEADYHDTLELQDGRILAAHALPRSMGGACAGRVWSFQDVTDQVRAASALQQSEQLFKDAFFGIPDLAAVIDLETGYILEVNDGAERVLGWRRDEALGRAAARLPIWPSRHERARVIGAVEKGGPIPEMDLALRRKDGQSCLLSGSTRVAEIGGRRCAVLLLRDVTERRRAEKERAQLASIVEHSDDAIIGLALDGTITSWNRGAEALYGFTAAETIGVSAKRLVEPVAWREIAELLGRAGREETVHNFETLGRAKDGSVRQVSLTLSPVRDASGRIVGASSIGRDVSERRRLEEDLRLLNLELERRVRVRAAELEHEIAEHQRARELLSSSERNYRELVESANSIILRWDTQGRITFFNEFGQSFFGLHEEEIVGRNVVGTIVPEVESSGRDLANLMRTIETRPDEFVINENENVRANGERVWIAWTNHPVLDASDKLVEILSVGNDITALKRAQQELVRAKEAAESADRLKSVFLATMSHELRTPLNSIIGFTGILLQGLAGALNEEQAKQLSMVQTSARHLHALINDVLDLSKIEAGQLTLDLSDYSLTEVVHTVFTAVESLATGKKLALTIDVASNLPRGHGDERRLVQVLLNLVGNAIKFTDKGEVAMKATMSDGSFTVAVRDTGPGISPSDQGKIFGEFQQADNAATKRKGDRHALR
jgi:PAS domain S-box-containing protein